MTAQRIILISCSLVLLVGVIRGESPFTRYFKLSESQEILNETVEGLEREIAQISAEIERIEKSPSYAEKILRDKYHVTDKNESIVFFAD